MSSVWTERVSGSPWSPVWRMYQKERHLVSPSYSIMLELLSLATPPAPPSAADTYITHATHNRYVDIYSSTIYSQQSLFLLDIYGNYSLPFPPL